MRFIARSTRVSVLCLSSILLVAQVCAASSAVVPSPAAPTFQTPVEYVRTYAADCVTPQTVFFLGDTVCAEAGDYDAAPALRFRRFFWSNPKGFVGDQTSIKVDPQTDKFIIPSSGDLARVGTWHVSTVNRHANRIVRAKFTVRDPRMRFADIVAVKWGPPYVDPGIRISYTVLVTNPGPDFAEGIEIVDEVPNEMTFYTVKQAAGPVVDCKTPGLGGTGATTCFAKGLEPGASIKLVFYYVVNREVSGRPFVSSVQAYSQTEDLTREDNGWSYLSTLPVHDSAETGTVGEEQ